MRLHSTTNVGEARLNNHKKSASKIIGLRCSLGPFSSTSFPIPLDKDRPQFSPSFTLLYLAYNMQVLSTHKQARALAH